MPLPHKFTKPLVMIFDEGRGLNAICSNLLYVGKKTNLNGYEDFIAFRAVRRALAKISTKLALAESTPFARIMLDTNSSVANFLPPIKHDPSYRPILLDLELGKLLLCLHSSSPDHVET